MPMFHIMITWKSILLIALIILGTNTMAWSENGRDFAGFYSVTEITNLGEEVQIAFEVEIMNYSGDDITDGNVVLAQTFPMEEPYTTFRYVSIPYRQGVTLKESIVILPRVEYDQWVKGAVPHVYIEDVTEQGNLRRTPVELLSRFIEKED